jgi:hypothetical protein
VVATTFSASWKLGIGAGTAALPEEKGDSWASDEYIDTCCKATTYISIGDILTQCRTFNSFGVRQSSGVLACGVEESVPLEYSWELGLG